MRNGLKSSDTISLESVPWDCLVDACRLLLMDDAVLIAAVLSLVPWLLSSDTRLDGASLGSIPYPL